jgi:diadenosine tetraphosphate (Ap4A) HIT family hydrolase
VTGPQLAACPICREGVPLDVIGELPALWITATQATPLPGYLCLVAKRHVREPFELPEAERAQFWTDVDRVARAIGEQLRPSKINYEIHGNTLDHLHLHLYPRSAGDRFEGRPIDGSHRESRSTTDLASLRAVVATLSQR